MDNLKTIKTALVGAGSMGKYHAHHLNEVSNFQAVCDTNEIRGNEIADKYNISYYKDYNHLPEEIDAAIIAVPTFLHRQVSLDLLSKNLHILIEKPISDSIESSIEIVDLATKLSKIVAVGHIERFNPAIQQAKKLLSMGKWGKLISVSAKRFSSYPKRIEDVGVIFDLSIHDVDIINYLVDSKVDSIVAYGGSYGESKHEDHVNITLAFDNKVSASCETSWMSPKKVREINLLTEKYFITIDMIEKSISLMNDGLSKPEKISVESYDSLKAEIVDFLKSVCGKGLPLVPGEQGLESVRLVSLALESLSQKKVIQI